MLSLRIILSYCVEIISFQVACASDFMNVFIWHQYYTYRTTSNFKVMAFSMEMCLMQTDMTRDVADYDQIQMS